MPDTEDRTEKNATLFSSGDQTGKRPGVESNVKRDSTWRSGSMIQIPI
jgi:hypothetical protein